MATTIKSTRSPRPGLGSDPHFPAIEPKGNGNRSRLLGLLGPAMVAGVAYLDPGNVASNTSAGAQFGFLLVWVVVAGNLMAWLIQYLSSKLGLVTGKSMADVLGERIRSRWGRRLYWLQAELVAMATDIAEIIGGAVALLLLFDLPLVVGGAITGVISMIILMIQAGGRQRTFERVIVAMLLIIACGFSAGVVLDPPPAQDVLGGLVPRLDGTASVLLAASILGATVMPHAIYAHSALSRDRFAGDQDRSMPRIRRLLWASRWDVTIALVIAGSVNLAIMLLAAHSLQGVSGTDTLEGVHAALLAQMGGVVATVFAIGLLASGLASTSVGAYAGGEVMHGLLRVRLPLMVRRLATLVPALLILGLGFDPTAALILSQIALSFGIPFALCPLVWLTAQRSVMGDFVNARRTTLTGVAAAILLVTLNAALLVLLVVPHVTS